MNNIPNLNCSFTPVSSFESEQENLQIEEFSKLSLGIHESEIRSVGLRSNSSQYFYIPILVEPKSQEQESKSGRSRRGSLELLWKPSSQEPRSLFNKSFLGNSCLSNNEPFYQHDNFIHKELSEKSCPVGKEETQTGGKGKGFEEGREGSVGGAVGVGVGVGVNGGMRKFAKTKNLLRNLSSYLHKFIKYNPRCRRYILKYYSEKYPTADDLECEEFYQSFLEWIGEQNPTNFLEYQRIWTENNKYLSIYRQICYKYYKEDLFCDIMVSRLSSKDIIQEYMPYFIKGLIEPKKFMGFQIE